MSYRESNNKVLNKKEEELERRRREIRSRTLDRLRKARMERMQEEEENRKREQEVIIGKWRDFLEEALGVWVEGAQVDYSRIIEKWGSVEQFNALYSDFTTVIAAYVNNPTPDQQLYKGQWELLKGGLERLDNLRGEEEKEQEETIEKWMEFSETALEIWKKGEPPNYDAINEKWGDMAYFDNLHTDFIDTMRQYNESPTLVQKRYRHQWKILNDRLKRLNKIRTEAGKIEKEKRKRIEEKRRKRQEEKNSRREKRREAEEQDNWKTLMEEVEEERRRQEEEKRKERREEIQKIRRFESKRDTFFENLVRGTYEQRDTLLKVQLKNGRSLLVNMNTVTAKEQWELIVKMLNNEQLGRGDWEELRNTEVTEYTQLVQFLDVRLDDILYAEFIPITAEITRSNLSGGNFIPLVINPKYKWMRELWEEFQITESIFDDNVEKGRIENIRREPCLYYALSHTKDGFNTEELERIIIRKYGGHGPSPALVTKLLKDEMGINLTYNSCRIVSDVNGIKTSQKYAKKKGDVHLNMLKYNFDQHYLNGKGYKWNEGAWDRINEWGEWKEFYKSYNGREVNGSFLIIEGIKRGILQPMLPIERKEILKLWDTPLNEKISRSIVGVHTKKMSEVNEEEKSETNSKLFDVIYFADTEAIVNGEYHKVYCICWKKMERESGQINEGHAYGYDCLTEFLDELRDQKGKKVVYFHNLKYDMSFFLEKIYLISRIMKGNKIYQMKVCFNRNIIDKIKKRKGYDERDESIVTFRDSYGLISLPIRAFSSAFGLGDDGEKEVFPYAYMSEETLEEGVVENCWGNEKPSWDEKKIGQFKSNLEKKGWIHDGRWNTKAYTLFYCKRDVDILMRGFLKFEEQVNREFGIDPLTTLTISSLAHKYFMKKVYLKEDMMLVHGPLSDFIRESCFGGRCMSNKNELYDIRGEIVDYDACSLYPSAMHRLYVPTGEIHIMDKPTSYYLEHLMDEGQTEPTEEKFISHFICEVSINKIRNHLDFPLTCKRGITNEYVDYEPTSNDKDSVCWSGVYTSIQLEDLIKYQGTEFSDIKNEIDGYPATGIYWIGKKSTLLSEAIQHVYKRRAEMKKNKDPTQTVYKLLMNSAYGKTIQKDILIKEKYFIDEDEAIQCLKQNLQTAINIMKMNEHCYILKMKKDGIELAAENWGLTYLGTMILAMSKRIMNEVFYAARAADVPIYYQDTDSIHLAKKDLNKLECKFEELYGRKIKGNDMGNFHVDFDPINGDSDVCSKRCIILGKKCYLDVLENSKGEQEYHVRMKGISKNAIAGVAEQHGGYVQLYEYLFNSPLHYIKFDLAKYDNCFAFDGIHPPKSLDEFSRSLHFEGKRNVLDLIKLNE